MSVCRNNENDENDDDYPSDWEVRGDDWIDWGVEIEEILNVEIEGSELIGEDIVLQVLI